MRSNAVRCRLTAVGLAAACLAGTGCNRGADVPFLESGIVRNEHVDVESGTRSFRIRVPDDAVLLRVDLREAEADLDLYARFGAPIEDLAADPDIYAEEDGYEERLIVDRAGDPELRSGEWFITVAVAEAEVRREGRRADEVAFEIAAKLLQGGGPVPLAVGGAHTAELVESEAFRIVYRLTDFDPAQSLRLDVVAPGRDVDLWVAGGEPARAPGEADIVAASSRGIETIVAVPEQDLESVESVFVTVAAPVYPGSDPVPFELFATAGTEPPPALAERPIAWPSFDRRDALDAALHATVEIHVGETGWGSGVLVSEAGHVMTNHHVVEGPGGEAMRSDAITVALTTDLGAPAMELFRAEVRATDRALDLALLQIVAGVYGAPLPAGAAFPVLELRRDDLPRLGETLTAIGYPGTGSDTARPTVSLSRGIVSGYVRAHDTMRIKTDAEISAGNSGGPVLDAQNRLVGIASSIVEDSGGRLGYVVPWSAVPAEWREEVAPAPRRVAPGAGRRRLVH